jgi:hypothetical protein
VSAAEAADAANTSGTVKAARIFRISSVVFLRSIIFPDNYKAGEYDEQKYEKDIGN